MTEFIKELTDKTSTDDGAQGVEESVQKQAETIDSQDRDASIAAATQPALPRLVINKRGEIVPHDQYLEDVQSER